MAPTQDQIIDISSPTNQVSWQTALMILVSLTINKMSQPSHRSCEWFRSQYAPYMYSSPIICAVDSLMLPGQLLFRPIVQGISFRQNVENLVQERFEETGKNLQTMLNQSSLRRIFFVLSGAIPLIKLASMKGVRGTQVLGLMSCGSFLVDEGFLLLANYYLNSHQDSKTKRSIASRAQRVGSKTDVLNGFNIYGSVALLGHIALLLWITFNLWLSYAGLDTSEIENWFGLPAGELQNPIAKFYWILKLLMILVYTLGAAAMYSTALCFVFMGCCGGDPVFLIILLTPACGLWHFCWMTQVSMGTTYATIGMAYAIGIGYGVALFSIKSIARQHPQIGRSLLIASEHKGLVRVDDVACLAFVFFVTNVLISTVWYWKQYDPAGTYNPSWMGVFGN